MVVAIASGKGGTGKTTVATSLAATLRQMGRRVRLIDCDVEEPNVHLFLHPTIERKVPVRVPTPVVDLDKCSHCGACADLCQFGAIVCLGDDVLVFPDLCHACGGCAMVCPEEAIVEEPREIGMIEEGQSDGIGFAHGRLNVGEPRAVPIIAELKNLIRGEAVTLIDSPPGTSCPMLESVKGSNFVCLVTEPTPFGLNDLEMAVAAIRQLNLPMGVVINRATLGDERVRRFCTREGIEILLELPNDRQIAEACSRGQVVVESLPAYRESFESLWERIESRMAVAAAKQKPAART